MFENVRHAWNRISVVISFSAILLYVSLRYLFHSAGSILTLPLWIPIIMGGLPLLYDLSRQALKREFGSDLLAGLSIVTATLMGELLVATIIVLMLTGGQTLEEFATQRASSVLIALARRMPSIAHRIAGDTTNDLPVSDIRIGDRLVVFPHEICPVDEQAGWRLPWPSIPSALPVLFLEWLGLSLGTLCCASSCRILATPS